LAIFWLLPVLAFPYNELKEDELIAKLQMSSSTDKNINVAECALIFAKTTYPYFDVGFYLDKLDTIAAEATKRSKLASEAKIIEAINSYFREKKIKADSILTLLNTSDTDRDKFMLNRVLDTMSGNCLGLSTIYFSIAERLDLPLSAVIIPQHVFLRHYTGSAYRNIEPTSFGADISETEYITNTRRVKAEKKSTYDSPENVNFLVLNKKQFLGLILYNRGVDNINRNNIQNAINDFTSALKLYPNFHEAYKSRGSLYLRQYRNKEALDDLKKANALEPNCPSTLFNLGNAYLNLDYITEALNNYDRASELAPDYSEIYHNRGLCYAEGYNYEKALAELTKAIKMSPSAKAYYDRAVINGSAKNYTEAISDYGDAISLDDKYIDAYHNRGIVYASQELYLNAVADFEKAISLVPEENVSKKSLCYKNLGLTFYKMKNYFRAADWFKKYVELRPDDDEIVNLLKQLK